MPDYEKMKKEYRKNSDYDNQSDEMKKKIDDAWNKRMNQKEENKEENSDTKKGQDQKGSAEEGKEKTKEDPRWKQLKDEYYKNNDYEHQSDEMKKKLDGVWDAFVKKKKNEGSGDSSDNPDDTRKGKDPGREREIGKGTDNSAVNKKEDSKEDNIDKNKKKESQDNQDMSLRSIRENEARQRQKKEHKESKERDFEL